MTLILDAAAVAEHLPFDQCIEAMAAVLAAQARGEVHMPLRSIVRGPDSAGMLGLMPSHRGGERPAYALKAVCVFPANPARGLDAHQGTVTLFDGESGVPLAILSGAALTAIRTAAVSALATRLLARADAVSLAIIGAGVQADAHLRALRLVREFDDVRVFSPTAAHAASLAERGGAAVRACESAREALRDADVVVLATNASEPVIERGWLAAGTHVNAIGASVRSARELDSETIAAAELFVDSRESAGAEAGDYLKALDSGAIGGPAHIRAELGELLIGRHPGRSGPQALTVFRSLGLAVEDLAAAELAVSGARRAGAGIEVAL